ncbi:DNA polymerase-like protein [Candidatus Rhodobacter oscarellae]|uniref:DNA polymerase-like protein n=2 Tax=Candidatus Rhodobacter oscarellae TaxID=1675527 RepID=A0A0J9E8A7_9RHOB|nr:DNA polymerase-like protein [Candidatus Rhodobacter lobularis]
MLAQPFAVVEDRRNTQVLASLSVEASAAGLTAGQPLRDAQAMCPELLTRLANPQAEAQFLAVLRRWAGKFSPWVSEEAPASLVVDLTGCAHLFGGEEPLLHQVAEDCADLGLTVQTGVADTVGAAWALARYAGQPVAMSRTGDAIDQEAYATRARAAKRRHWTKGGAAPKPGVEAADLNRIAPPGKAHSVLAPLPVSALRIDPDTAENLVRLGLRRIGDLSGTPRAALARRFGRALVQRLDQALGMEPEPVSPAKPPLHFAVRLTLPEPIGLDTDIIAAVDRLLPELEARLKAKGRGARRVKFQLFRADSTMQTLEVGMARASASPDRIKPLLLMKLPDIDAGFGIDCVRIEAHVTEPLHDRQHRGHLDAAAQVNARLSANTALDDLIGRLGARIGLDAITRMHPADSHIPEKTSKRLAAAWSEPAAAPWPRAPTPRPLLIWRPEPVQGPDMPALPLSFRWRGRAHEVVTARGPERISPEWWLDEPDWRSGVRDYYQVTTGHGDRLWLYYAHGGALSSGWFCHGSFS